MSRKVVIYNMYIAPRHLAQKVHFTFCHMKKMTFATCKLSNPSPLSSWQIYKMLVARMCLDNHWRGWWVALRGIRRHPLVLAGLSSCLQPGPSDAPILTTISDAPILNTWKLCVYWYCCYLGGAAASMLLDDKPSYWKDNTSQSYLAVRWNFPEVRNRKGTEAVQITPRNGGNHICIFRPLPGPHIWLYEFLPCWQRELMISRLCCWCKMAAIWLLGVSQAARQRW